MIGTESCIVIDLVISSRAFIKEVNIQIYLSLVRSVARVQCRATDRHDSGSRASIAVHIA